MQARSEIATAKDAIAHARMLAIGRGDPLLTVLHVTHVLADQEWMASALREVGADMQVLRTSLERRIESAGAAEELAFGLDALGARELLVSALLRTPVIADVLVEVGTGADELRRALVRRGAEALDDTTLPDGDDRVEIIFHNDAFTTMEFVIEVLQRSFDLPASHAMHLMLSVHHGGMKVVKTCPAQEARQQIDDARAAARAAGMPLRITWRRKTSAEPERDG